MSRPQATLARRVFAENRKPIIWLAGGLALNVLVYAFGVYPLSERVANVGTRAEELAEWNALGFDRCTAGIPGLHNTDEGLYEFIDDCRTAGIDFFDRQPASVA